MTIEIDKITDSGAPEEVIEVYRLLKKFKEEEDRTWWVDEVYKRPWEVAWGKSDKLWKEDEKRAMEAKGQIPIAINDLSKGIQGSCAVATANNPGINALPIGESDLYVAELLKRGFDFVWTQNEGNACISDVAKESKTGSLGVIKGKFDEAKGKWGKIVFESGNPLDYYWDKKSRKSNKSDSPLIEAHLVTRKYAKENYDVTDDDLDFKSLSTDDNEGKSTAGTPGDEYANKADKPTIPGQDIPEDQQDVWEIEAWLIKKKKEHSIVVIDPEGNTQKLTAESKKFSSNAKKYIEGMDPRFKVKEIVKHTEIREQRIIVGRKLISSEENPLGLDSDGDPVVPMILFPHDRSSNGYFVGPAYRGLEISRSRNKRRMQTIYVVSKNIDAPIVRTAESKWINDPVHGDELIVEKTSAFPPHRLLPGTTSIELVNMEQRDEAALNEEFDMHDVMKGKLPPGIDSGRLVLALQDQAGMMSTPFIKQVIETGIVRLAKIIYSMMLMYWPREMWLRLIEEEEIKNWMPEKEKIQFQQEQQQIMQKQQMQGQGQMPNQAQPVQPGMPPQPGQNPPGDVAQPQIEAKPDAEIIAQKWMEALEKLRPKDPTKKPQIDLEGLDVKIESGSTMPTNRMAKASLAMEKLKVGMYDVEAALDYDDDPNKDKIVQRMKKKEQDMMAAVAAGQNVKETGKTK